MSSYHTDSAREGLPGVRRVDRLYIELLYKCNFACRHCFQGEKLKHPASIPIEQVEEMIDFFRHLHATKSVIFVGGEPFLYDQIDEAIDIAFSRGLSVEICTNGHKFTHRKIRHNGAKIDNLRVSIDGLQDAHDDIRQRGSFKHALEAIRIGAGECANVTVTTVVNSQNVADVQELAQTVAAQGATRMKLHHLRLVGLAADNPHLAVKEGADDLRQLRQLLEKSEWPLEVVFDQEVLGPAAKPPLPADSEEDVDLERIEISPEYTMTMSCNAVGEDAHSFEWDPERRTVTARDSHRDEVHLGIPAVRYVSA